MTRARATRVEYLVGRDADRRKYFVFVHVVWGNSPYLVVEGTVVRPGGSIANVDHYVTVGSVDFLNVIEPAAGWRMRDVRLLAYMARKWPPRNMQTDALPVRVAELVYWLKGG